MRKVAIEIFYWIEHWSDDQAAWFGKAKECGFDAVEISLLDGLHIDVPRLRRELDRLGLGIYCSLGLTPETDITSPHTSVQLAGIEHLKRCLEMAHRLGSPLLGGVTYAPWLHFPDDADLRPYRDRSAAALHEVGRTAADLGMTLCLEILNRFETFMFNTVAEALVFLRHVEHPAVKLQLDTYHMNMEEDSLAGAIRQAGPAIGHFHCAAGNRKLPGLGSIDWPAVKAALDDVNYQGALVIETFPNPNVETGRTAHTWRPLVRNFDAEARAALAFLRHTVA